MKNTNIFLLIMAFAISAFLFSCNKEQKQEQQINPQQEQFVDKEKQLKEKEELLRIREENLNAREQAIIQKEKDLGLRPDSTKTEVKDTSKLTLKEKDKKNDKKEKELNKNLDNPTETIKEYIEDLQRAVGDASKFDDNIKKANNLWEKDRLKLLKSSYKNAEKIVIVSEPSVLTNKGEKASVKMKLKRIDKDKKETSMTVTYFLVADKNGKWKIKNNAIEK
jgi:hypothetical protein